MRMGRRGLGLVASVAVAVAAGGLAAAWPRLFPGPLAEGLAAYGRGEWAAAAAVARDRLKAAPGDPEALRLRARAAARLGQDAVAEATYPRLDRGAMAAEDWALLGVAMLRRRQPALAEVALERALASDPRQPEALDALIGFRIREGKPAEAEAFAARLEGIPGWEARGGLSLGGLRLDSSDPAGAAEALARALRRDPKLGPDARKALARALLASGRPAGAREALEGVLARGADAEASWLLSRAALQEGSAAGAGAALRDAGDFGAGRLLAPEPAPYLGAESCAECHGAIHRAQQSSRHARTRPSAEELREVPLPEGPLADPDDPAVVHTLRRGDGGRLVQETTVEGRTMGAAVAYAFGSGRHARTFVGRGEKGWMGELRLSHYRVPPEWDRTPGQPARPEDASGYLGISLDADGVRRCLDCHSTNFRAARDRTGPEAGDRGIGCERCHGPGGHHARAVALDFSDLAIARPKRATAAEVVGLCGQCHSRPASVPAEAPSAVRFQATALVESRCFTASDGAFGCTSCHDPHRDAETSASWYEARCLECHGGGEGGDAASRGSPCPVNARADCLGCHMPPVSGAMPHSTFTDHHIRVRRPAGKGG
jgi:Tfp pilus assembly protein PilF